MKKILSALATLIVALPSLAQDVPPPERLLPADTLAVITIPDMAKARRAHQDSPRMQLWNDPSLKGFKEKLLAKLEKEVIEPFQQEMGIQLTNYLHLAQGQLTLAITGNGWTGGPETEPGVVLLIDSKEQSDRLAKALTDLRDKWREDGNPMKTERIRGVEFTVLIIENEMEEDAEDPLDEQNVPPSERRDLGLESKAEPDHVYVGQSGSLLLIGEFKTDLEKILSLQNGGPVLSLGESSNFMPDYNRSFREAQLYGWMNFETFINAIEQSIPEADPSNPMIPSGKRIFRALGIPGLKKASFSVSLKSDGEHVHFNLGVPDAERRGLFRLLTFEPKDSAPPAFVPQDAFTFTRYRINMRNGWRTLENMINEISPQVGGLLRMQLGVLGKDKDPNFDFRRNFVENLGDDVMAWRTAPKGNTLEAMTQQPEVMLIGSPNAEQLAGALKTLASMLPPDVVPMEEREFLGRQVWELKIPLEMQFDESGEAPTQTFSFTSDRGYLVVSSDSALLEEFLRSSEGGTRPLINRQGLRFSSEKVGGMNTGLYGFSDDKATAKYIYQFFTSEANGQTGAMTGFNQFLMATGVDTDQAEFKEWVDVSLLPPFERIEKYFDYTVYAGSMENDGMHIRLFTPKPRALR